MHKSIYAVAMAAAMFLASPGIYAQEATAQDRDADDQTPRAQAIEYSHGYEVRAKLHKWASYATLPLVGSELVIANHLYNDPSPGTSSARGAHIAVGTAITSLFAVNTVTGVWNMWEARTDPNHRKVRALHGLLMLGADAGFVATAATGPGHHAIGDPNYDSERSKHRAIAVTSLSVAAGSYVMMLIFDH